MQNPDINAVAQMANATLALASVDPGSGSNFANQASDWVAVTNQQIQRMGTSAPLLSIMNVFSLDKASAGLLCYSLLPTLNTQYSHFFKELSANKDQPLPSLDLLTTLVTTSYKGKNQLIGELGPQSPLFFWQLLLKEEVPQLPARIKPSNSLLQQFEGTNNTTDSGLLQPVNAAPLQLPLDKIKSVPDTPIIVMQGGIPARQISTAYQLCQDIQQPIVQLNTASLNDLESTIPALKQALLKLALTGTALYWQEGIAVLNDQPAITSLFHAWLRLKGTRLLLGQSQFMALPKSLQALKFKTIQLKPADRGTDELIWRNVGEKFLGLSQIDYASLNSRYYTDYPRIQQTFEQVKNNLASQETPTNADVQNGYLATSPPQLGALAHRTPSTANFQDLILSENTQQQMDAIEKAYLNRILLSPKKQTGVMCIFEGTPGSGKTLAAESLGNQLGLPLYRIDYPRLVLEESSAENDLTSFFSDAAKNSACLILEDAETLFSDSDNQPPKAKTAYLIHLMEAYNGLIVLLTNQKPQVDKNLFRKSMFSVNFQPLSAQQQYDLFMKILNNHGVKVDSKVKLTQLMEQLNGTGRQVKNIVDNAILSANPGNVPINEIVIAATDLAKAIEMEVNKQPTK